MGIARSISVMLTRAGTTPHGLIYRALSSINGIYNTVIRVEYGMAVLRCFRRCNIVYSAQWPAYLGYTSIA